MGNLFPQALYDGETLNNLMNYQAISLQFIDTTLSRNFVVAIAFAWYKDSKATKVYEIFTTLTIARTGFDTKDLWGSCVAYGYSQKVAVLVSV